MVKSSKMEEKIWEFILKHKEDTGDTPNLPTIMKEVGISKPLAQYYTDKLVTKGKLIKRNKLQINE